MNINADNLLDICENKYLCEGGYGSIYKLNDYECLKIFKFFDDFNPELINKIRDLKLSNYYEIKKLLFCENSFIGYLMKYYNNLDLDLLTTDVSYILDSLYSLYNSIKLLSKNNIYVCDMRIENCLLTKDGIIIIDIDNYVYNKLYSDNNDLCIDNLESLRDLFISLFLNSKNKFHKDENIDLYKWNLNGIFYLDNGFENAKKTLGRYKYPIDYFKG